jgi:multidrug efflux pump subunit AcrA (membrane-fusion protein)
LVRPGRLRRAARYWPVGFLGCGVVAAAFWFGRPKTAGADFLTATVVRGDLPVVVSERGELDSTKSIMVRCDVEGERSKLVHIVPEGTHVKKGEEVGRFDTEELKKAYDQQQVKWKAAEGKAAATRGDYEVQENK